MVGNINITTNAQAVSEDNPLSAPSATKPKKPIKDELTGKQIAVIGDEDTVIGFGLTGIKYLTIITSSSNDKEILSSIKEYIENSEVGFIIITEPVAERVRTDFERLIREKPLYPIFIELPDKRGELPERVDPIKVLIRRAIGMEITKSKE